MGLVRALQGEGRLSDCVSRGIKKRACLAGSWRRDSGQPMDGNIMATRRGLITPSLKSITHAVRMSSLPCVIRCADITVPRVTRGWFFQHSSCFSKSMHHRRIGTGLCCARNCARDGMFWTDSRRFVPTHTKYVNP